MWNTSVNERTGSFCIYSKWKLNWNVNRNHVNIDLWAILYFNGDGSNDSGSGWKPGKKHVLIRALLTFLHVKIAIKWCSKSKRLMDNICVHQLIFSKNFLNQSDFGPVKIFSQKFCHLFLFIATIQYISRRLISDFAEMWLIITDNHILTIICIVKLFEKEHTQWTHNMPMLLFIDGQPKYTEHREWIPQKT